MALLNVWDAKFTVEEKVIIVSGPYCINEYVKQIYQRNSVTTPVIKCVSMELYKFNLTHTQKNHYKWVPQFIQTCKTDFKPFFESKAWVRFGTQSLLALWFAPKLIRRSVAPPGHESHLQTMLSHSLEQRWKSYFPTGVFKGKHFLQEIKHS